ncbi:MAG: hypothetical protein HY236_11515 [Acidobacteria bacterium]|nr:hypothetical protein [Acidobacteriota bacterium]
MANSFVHRVSDLAPEERTLVERWLGRAVSQDETISLNAYKPHAAPVGPELESLRQEIVSQAREIGSRQEIREEEADALVDEAFAEIRRKPA